MEKELLQKKKDEIILCKKNLNQIAKEKEDLIEENTQLDIKYQETISNIEILKNKLYDYKTVKRVNKFSKILLFVSIIAILGCLGIIFTTPFWVGVSLIEKLISGLVLTGFFGAVGSIPYFSTKKYLKNINVDDIKSQLELSEEDKNNNRETYDKNISKIENLESSNTVVANVLYLTTLDLLEDKEVREEIMDYIVNNYPSIEVVNAIADSMLEEPKVKLKRVRK